MKTTNIINSKFFQSIITVFILTAFSIAQNTFSIEVGDGTIDVLYNSDADIGGFQFNVEGATVTGASGGDAASNGFMMSNSATTVLGFSLTGSVIPAGSGTLVVVTADITGDVSLSGIVVADPAGGALDFTFDDGGGSSVLGCTDESACNYNTDATEDDGSCDYALDCAGECGGSAEVDECGECGGDGSSCTTSTIDILYNTMTDIAGFQFNVDGATVSGASGGAAADAGFTISTGGSTVLAFSFSGATIPAGSGVLVQVEIDGDANAACLSDVILSDPVGAAIDNEINDCLTISQVEIIPGCTDSSACNYDADATEDDGSCTYAEENYDCDGNCIVGEDCAGECGGSSIEDECGVCDGPGIGHGACDCDGNVEDCADECGGSAVEDGCGVCGGDGTSCIPVQLGFGTVADGNMEITYNSPLDIAGFQFNLTGVNITSASDGAAGENGFMISNNSTTVIAFSLTGATIPAGSGVLIELGFEATAEQACLDSPVISDPDGQGFDIEIGECADLDYACDDADMDGVCDDVDDCVGQYDECGICNGDGIADGACDCAGNVEDCAGVCGGDTLVDECGVCGGGAESCFIELSIGSVADGNMEILINNTIPIQGFQFNIAGADLSSASGGIAGEYDYSISIGVNSMVLGFSFDGVQIPAGEGVLTNLAYNSTMNEACLINEIIALGDWAGGFYEINVGDCVALDCGEGNDADCTGACGGSAVEDCAGECGGSAVEDECGVCNGDGITDGACDCDGNVDLGCGCGEAGPSGCDNECGSTAEVDECGVCGGDGSSCPSTVDLSIELIAGWNWISLNVLPADPSIGSVLGGLGIDALFINSQSSGSATYYPDYGIWAGGLTAFEPGSMYLLKMDAAATLVVTGAPVDVASTSIDLIAGWNWLGYLPQNPGDVGVALESLGTDAEFINSQASGSATYYPDYGIWAGGLTSLLPGTGYLLKMGAAAEFYYPEFDGMTRLSDNVQKVVLTNTVSDWNFNYADYEFIGNITASIESYEDFDGDIVGVFVDGKCRGLAERMYFPLDDTYYYMIQVYSNVAEGEELTFKYYDKTNDEVIEYSETLTFENNMIVGDGFNTFGLSRESNLSQPKAYGIGDVYPNPFNPVTSFEYTMPEDGMVKVAVYDISGRMVAELINGYMSAGTYPVTWDANDLSSGVYMLHMISGNFNAVQKVMLIK